MINKLFNESNIVTMSNMSDNMINGIITSPPYNLTTQRKDGYYNNGYADIDNLSESDYLELRLNEFKEFERIVKNDGVICYNISYHTLNPILPLKLINLVHDQTNLTLVDIIAWKKSNSMPFQSSSTNLSRIVENIYIMVNKDYMKTFTTNKKISKINEKTGQKFYKKYDNFIEAPNNDKFKSKLKASFSSELVMKLIHIYFPKESLIYDPFMGIGTTAKGCMMTGRNFIGSELDAEIYQDSMKFLSQ